MLIRIIALVFLCANTVLADTPTVLRFDATQIAMGHIVGVGQDANGKAELYIRTNYAFGNGTIIPTCLKINLTKLADMPISPDTNLYGLIWSPICENTVGVYPCFPRGAVVFLENEWCNR